MILFYQPEVATGVTWLSEEESKHCTKVLRKQAGEAITITDGKGFFYDCTITKADSKRCEFIVDKTIPETRLTHYIHIAIAPTKNTDRLEWFVEKATELGVDEITLVNCDHSERSFIKIERLQKVAISAMKQSQKATLPMLRDLIPFKNILTEESEQRFIAFVDHSNPQHLFQVAGKRKRYLILIGPEGDFSKEELALALQQGFVKVSLGNSRLRTETAGITACCLLNAINNTSS